MKTFVTKIIISTTKLTREVNDNVSLTISALEFSLFFYNQNKTLTTRWTYGAIKQLEFILWFSIMINRSQSPAESNRRCLIMTFRKLLNLHKSFSKPPHQATQSY